MNAAMQTLVDRNDSEELRRLERLNADLQGQVTDLRTEVESLKQELMKGGREIASLHPPFSGASLEHGDDGLSRQIGDGIPWIAPDH